MGNSIRASMKVSILGLLVGCSMGAVPVHAQPGEDAIIDFSIKEQFLKRLADGHTILPAMSVALDHRTKKVHALAADCEMHIAGRVVGIEFGTPPAVVVEPPGLCKNDPPAVSATDWPSYLDASVMGKTCQVIGFPRIFTEHAANGGDVANPNHVFEIHPALEIACGASKTDFRTFLNFYPKLRAIKPSSASSCFHDRKLKVRYNAQSKSYEFLENKATCGNFAIIEIGYVDKKWIRETGGGHSAIARISPDGETRVTAKLYTLAGTEADGFLKRISADRTDSTPSDPRARDDLAWSTRRIWHGMFTYDYFAMVKAVRTPGGMWSKSKTWKDIPFPLAFVLTGEADEAPWDSEDKEPE